MFNKGVYHTILMATITNSFGNFEHLRNQAITPDTINEIIDSNLKSKGLYGNVIVTKEFTPKEYAEDFRRWLKHIPPPEPPPKEPALVNDYQTDTVSSEGCVNHDYNNEFLLNNISVSASGNAKFELIVDGSTTNVQFTDRISNTQVMAFSPPIVVASTVRIVATNRETAAMDLYSTITGVEV